jgi:antirestriction protein ArdC
MAELRGLHAPLAAFLHIIDTSRLLKVLKADTRAIFSIASYASQAADWLRDGPKVEEPAPNLDMADAIPH